MSKPVLVVLTRNQKFSSRLPALLSNSYRVILCDELTEACELCIDQSAFGFLADFYDLIAGGHLEDRILDELQRCMPEIEVMMLTTDECPELLERRAACTSVLHRRGTCDVETIAEQWKDLLPVTAGVRGTNNSSAEDAVPYMEKPAPEVIKSDKPSRELSRGSSLQGITRNFETNMDDLKSMLDELEVASRHDVAILLIGETGSGKTFLSRLIHEISPRRDEPFLHVACGALPGDLIESDLFGHVRGAFTSASNDKDGKFVAAGHGTILLDEIDVLEPEQQVKLLRVIETGEFEPVGSNQTLRSQARLVVASNLELQPLVEKGRFRPDLYYRLNMLKFEIPPLRRRPLDIVPLAKKFIRQLTVKHNVDIHTIDSSFFETIQAYPWPGNVRELENVVQRAVIYCREGHLKAEHLPRNVLVGEAGPTNDPSVQIASQRNIPRSLEQKVALTEKEIIEQTLFNNNHSRTNTAKALGISRVTLYNKMKKYGMSTRK